MNAPADAAPPLDPAAADSATERIAHRFGIGSEPARRLSDAGFTTVDRVRALSRDELIVLGLEPEDADRVRSFTEDPLPIAPVSPADAPDSPWTADEDRVAERILSSVKTSGRPRRRLPARPTAGSTDVLKKWVEGDDRAMEAWIRSIPTSLETASPDLPGPSPSPSPAPPAAAAVAAPAAPGPAPTSSETTVPLGGLAPGAALSAQVLEREQTLVRWLTQLLDRMNTDQFDPATILTDLEEAHRQLFEERTRRIDLEGQVEQVKRGSIAVIKYVRNREAVAREQAIHDAEVEIAELKLRLLKATEGAGPAGPASSEHEAEIESRIRGEYLEREASSAEREDELRKRVAQLEGELRGLRAESGTLDDRETLLSEKADALPEAVAERLRELELRDKELSNRENDLRAKFEEVRAAAAELERRKEPIAFKEKQFSQWELQLRTLKQALEIEARTLEQTRSELAQSGGVPPAELRRLEDLKAELAQREDEIRNKETLLRQQAEDLQGQLAQSEATSLHRGATSDAQEVKASSGVRRLDDLLFGGLPKGTQVLLNGPAHTGKEILARLFIAEGLKRGIPAIWVVTDKTVAQIREEMTPLLPSYSKLEKEMVRYVDLYSRSIGVTQTEAGVRLLQSTDKGLLEQLTNAVNGYALELKEKSSSYRLVFESVSTVTAYLDTTATFRFLQPFTGRRKLEGAVAYYVLETGMHSESDVETLEHMVDGSLNLKVEQLKTFLSVRGITDVQSRAWVGYTFTKRAFSLGSFSLDHIR